MGQDQQLRTGDRAARRKLWLRRLYLVLRFTTRAWHRVPMPAVSAIMVAGAVVLYFGFGNLAGYVPSVSGVYRFFRPVKHGCSQTQDFKTGRMVWADDGSPADPPLTGYTWDAWKCDYVAPQQIWMRR